MRAIAVVYLLATAAWAQAAPNAPQITAQQFGPAFTLVSTYSAIAADLDGDGTEDLVLVATAKDTLTDQLEFHYKVIDPYNSYFGFGDANITAQFSANDAGLPRVLLVLHDWRATAPKVKFVILNLPFEQLSLGRLLRKKKVFPSITLSDHSGLTSDLYWAGKQWKWADRSVAME